MAAEVLRLATLVLLRWASKKPTKICLRRAQIHPNSFTQAFVERNSLHQAIKHGDVRLIWYWLP